MYTHIAFLDSGVGGLPYLSKVRELLPDAAYSYIADPQYFPYGEKTPDKVRSILRANTQKIMELLKPDLIVIACNTASVVALEDLRSIYDIPFIGVVPAVKPAAAQSRNGRFGLLATSETVDNPYTQKLIDAFASKNNVYRFAGADIITLVEKRFFDITENEKEQVLKPAADFFLSHQVDTVVLGCTHFLHVKDDLSRLLGQGVTIVDSVEGVSKQAVKIALKSSKSANTKTQSLYIASQPQSPHFLEKFADLFSLTYMDVLTDVRK